MGWFRNPLAIPYSSDDPDIEIGRHAVAIDERSLEVTSIAPVLCLRGLSVCTGLVHLHHIGAIAWLGGLYFRLVSKAENATSAPSPCLCFANDARVHKRLISSDAETLCPVQSRQLAALRRMNRQTSQASCTVKRGSLARYASPSVTQLKDHAGIGGVHVVSPLIVHMMNSGPK